MGRFFGSWHPRHVWGVCLETVCVCVCVVHLSQWCVVTGTRVYLPPLSVMSALGPERVTWLPSSGTVLSRPLVSWQVFGFVLRVGTLCLCQNTHMTSQRWKVLPFMFPPMTARVWSHTLLKAQPSYLDSRTHYYPVMLYLFIIICVFEVIFTKSKCLASECLCWLWMDISPGVFGFDVFAVAELCGKSTCLSLMNVFIER